METTHFKTKLEAELQQLTIELEAIATLNPDTGDWVATPEVNEPSADENEVADDVESWNERRALLAQLEIRYRNVKRALDKIDAGTYGICEITGGEISPERLEANPAARTCAAHMNEEADLPL